MDTSNYEAALQLLRPYQLEGVQKLLDTPRGFLFDEMGLGKTPQTLLALRGAPDRPAKAPILIICPNHAIRVWEREITKWWPEAECYTMVMVGKPEDREQTRRIFHASMIEDDSSPRIIITNYHMMEEIFKWKCSWWGLVYDEAHALSNHKTKRFERASLLLSKRLVLLTGTPMRKGPEELFCYLHLIDPKKFKTHWKFINQYCHTAKCGFGTEILGVKNRLEMRALLKKYGVRRLKKDVRQDIPPLTRQFVPIDLPPSLRRKYDTFASEMLLIDGTSFVIAPNSLAKATKLREIVVCPSMLGLSEISALWPPALEITSELIREDKSVVIFTPFVEAVEQLKLYFQNHHAAMHVYKLHGQQGRSQNQCELERFQTDKDPAVLIATLAMGASWDATKASTAIFVGYSYSPIECYQSEGRLHRHGQADPVTCYYLGGRNTIDEHIIDVLDEKVSWQNVIINPKRIPGA